MDFELWLEWEHYDPPQLEDSPAANISITLAGGRRYALNLWLREYFATAVADDRARGINWTTPPDLFVERLDRATIEQMVPEILGYLESRPDLLCND